MAFSLHRPLRPALLLGLFLLGIFFTFWLLVSGNSIPAPSSQKENSGLSAGEEDSFRILDQATGDILTVPDREFLTGVLQTKVNS